MVFDVTAVASILGFRILSNDTLASELEELGVKADLPVGGQLALPSELQLPCIFVEINQGMK